MQQAPDIRFIGMEPSGALAAAARDKAAKLEQFCPQIVACHVAIELAHKHRQQGRPFAIRVELTVPGRQLAVSRIEHEDPYVALRDAFDTMKRQLEDTMERMREPLKTPPQQAEPPEGKEAAS